MAVTYVDGDVSADTTSVSSVTGLTWVSHNAADLAIVPWALVNTATPTLDATLTNSSNQVDTNVRGIIGTKATSGSESGAISLTCDAPGANRMAAALALYRDCILGQIVFLGEASGTAQTSHTCPAITPAVAGSGFVLVFVERVGSTVAPAGTPAGFTKRKEWSTGGTGGTSVVVYDDLSGTHGTSTFTPANVVSLTASTSALVFLIELKPASQTFTLGIASETDGAVAMVFTKVMAAGLASEIDTAPVAVTSKGTSLAAAAETDSATALVPAKLITLGLATETDAPPALVITRSAKQLGQATETDSAPAVAVSKLVTLGAATESDTALAMNFVAAGVTEFGVAAETDTAYGVLVSKQVVLGIATETATARPMVLSKAAPIGVGAETDTAFALIISGLTDIDFAVATETDSALPLSISKTALLARADETDTAAALNTTKAFALAVAGEIDTATALVFGQPLPVPGHLVATHGGPVLVTTNQPSSRLEVSHEL